MQKIVCLLLIGVVGVTTLGQSKRKRKITKKLKPQVALPCGVQDNPHPELDLAAGTVAPGTYAPSPWSRAATSHSKDFYYNRNWVCVDHIFIRVWVKSVSRDGENLTTGSMALYELKCKTNQIRVTKHIEYDKDGQSKASDSYSDYRAKWEQAVPESVGKRILNTVCNKRVD